MLNFTNPYYLYIMKANGYHMYFMSHLDVDKFHQVFAHAIENERPQFYCGSQEYRYDLMLMKEHADTEQNYSLGCIAVGKCAAMKGALSRYVYHSRKDTKCLNHSRVHVSVNA